ncbi:hypothetical protein SAMD00019534_062590 [Acytostelium subglobosum LB1]|uniref:hypothetical protein n=1 Tax=Acytostelium subglobosum LB1 TaxID=1410327 RepID=UPI000644EA07|nr:hypothetical protein SAMD00019534_062590 [Acytostelium subglobosum LB1]GAM23084.1 hypothetical protein SAMD00019534_062590 [Acytostelium subglobosum LB1]|eukprot:XP_012754311.1 hypothetical protein SAMD00019534_062590 [Acytostelium subglobosum LB1]
MPSLSDQEKNQLSVVIGTSCDVYSSTVARLYEGKQGMWEYTGVVGAVSVVTHRIEKTSYIKIIDIKSAPRIIFEQELYDNFEFTKARDFFYTFEGDTTVYGLSFTDVNEASDFQSNLNRAKTANSARPQSMAMPAAAAAQPAKATPAPAPKKEEKEKKKKKGFFSSMFGGGDEEPENFEISTPSSFRHESHIGWDASQGFEIRNIPPDWRKLFQSAGITKKELKNAETAQFIVNIIGENLAAGGGAPPMSGGRAPPPPPPPTSSKGTPPPPPPPSHKGTAPPPPPPPPVSGGPPPPPPPPSHKGAPPPPPPHTSGGPPPPPPPTSNGGGGNGGGGGRADLLSAIRGGASLKKVDHSEPLPDIQKLDDAGNRSLVDTLALAMMQRRGNMREDDQDEDDDDSGWSDSE